MISVKIRCKMVAVSGPRLWANTRSSTLTFTGRLMNRSIIGLFQQRPIACAIVARSDREIDQRQVDRIDPRAHIVERPPSARTLL